MSKVIVLGVSGSPREGRNTGGLLEVALGAAEEAGAEVDALSLAGLKILPCTGCNTCVKETRCPQPEEDYYTNNIYHILVKYYPCFEDLRPVNMWAGQYAINGYDGIPVVADYPGLIYVGAASGSGIMKCDALGRIVGATHAGREHAELYNGVKFRCSDLGIHKRNVDREEFII